MLPSHLRGPLYVGVYFINGVTFISPQIYVGYDTIQHSIDIGYRIKVLMLNLLA
jgi:hypothetical protein